MEALSEALSGWGEDTGAVVVISHDKAFCEKVGFTHVATVQDGCLKMEQRDTRESDWSSSYSSTQPTLSSANASTETEDTNTNNKSATPEEDRKRKKQVYNAPKRIAKIEETVMKREEKIAQLDKDMMANGSDVNKLVDLTKQKDGLEAEVLELMEEWEELEGLLAKVAA